jgi:hypothetical protein
MTLTCIGSEFSQENGNETATAHSSLVAVEKQIGTSSVQFQAVSEL